MFHKLFRLLGRRDRLTAAQIEEEALLALEQDERETTQGDESLLGSSPFGRGFDCGQDVQFLP